MDEYDALDGVKNRLIENPLECRLDILNLACETSASDTKCLTAAQVGAAQAVYASPKGLQTGQNAYPGFPFGS
jgi:feruloyl esterase